MATVPVKYTYALRDAPAKRALWHAGLNTPARVAGRVFDAFAYFAVKPGFNPDGTYTASIAGQG